MSYIILAVAIIIVLLVAICCMYPGLQDIANDEADARYQKEIVKLKRENMALRSQKVTIDFKVIGGGNYDTRREN